MRTDILDISVSDVAYHVRPSGAIEAPKILKGTPYIESGLGMLCLMNLDHKLHKIWITSNDLCTLCSVYAFDFCKEACFFEIDVPHHVPLRIVQTELRKKFFSLNLDRFKNRLYT